MPVIQAKLIEGVFDAAQKKQIIEKLTEAMVSIEGEGLRDKTFVLIEETKDGEWGIGGQAMTAAMVREVAAAGRKR
jgi:4-oxalocrotonate tautomerase